MITSHRTLVLFVALCLPSAVASAQGNYRSAPSGGRSALTGGTGIALASDGTGPFLNPATMTRITDSRVSFSVNLYSFSFSKAGNWFQPGPVDKTRFGDVPAEKIGTTDIQFSALPSTFCIFLFSHSGESPLSKLGERRDDTAQNEEKKADAADDTAIPPSERQDAPGQLAVCFGTVQRATFSIADQNVRSRGSLSTREMQTVQNNWNRYAFGPSYATHLTDRLSVGVSLHGNASTYRGVWSANALTVDPAAPLSATTSFDNDDSGISLDMSMIAGATYRMGPHTVGLRVGTPSLHVYGHGHANLTTSYTTPTQTTSSSTLLSGTFAAYTPFEVGAGWGIEWNDTMVELDASVAFPLSKMYEADFTGSRADVSGAAVRTTTLHVVESDPATFVINGSLGLEHFTSRSFSVLGGLFTDLSSVPAAALDKTRAWNLVSSRSDRVGASLGVGSYGRGGELLVGFDTSYGWGDRLAANLYQAVPTLARTAHGDVTVTLVVAGSTSTRTLSRVVDQVKTLVAPTP